MGKESKLRSNYANGETRLQYANGDRKFYDKDACPAGADEYVWSLALYFEQRLSNFPVTTGRPILYTEIYEKISSDRDLTRLLSHATIGMCGKGEGVPAVTAGTYTLSDYSSSYLNNVNIYDFLIYIIDYYFNNYYDNKLPSINDFTSKFNSIKSSIIESDYYNHLSTNGTRVPVVPKEPIPSRREEKVQKVLDITVNRVYSEQDMREKFSRFLGGK